MGFTGVPPSVIGLFWNPLLKGGLCLRRANCSKHKQNFTVEGEPFVVRQSEGKQRSSGDGWLKGFSMFPTDVDGMNLPVSSFFVG